MLSRGAVHYTVALLGASILLLAENLAADIKADQSTKYTLPSRIDLGPSSYAIRLEFKGPERTLSILYFASDGTITPVIKPSTNYHLQLVCLGNDGQGVLVGGTHQLFWWGEHSCSMAQLPVEIRDDVNNIVALCQPRECGEFIHSEVTPNRMLMVADGKPVAKAMEFWEQANKKDTRFSVVNSPRLPAAAPKGWVIEHLEVGGYVHRPSNWHASRGKETNPLKWIISKEDPDKGPYETGVSIQMFGRIRERVGKSPLQFATDFLAEKRRGAKKVHDFCEKGLSDSDPACLEVEEGNDRVHYKITWSTDMDMAWIATSRAPESLWDQYRETLLAVTDGVKLLDAEVVRRIISKAKQTNSPANSGGTRNTTPPK